MVLTALAAGAVTAASPALASAATAEPKADRAVPRSATVAQPVAQQKAAQPAALLQNGTRGAQVRELQRVLNAWYPSQTPLAKDGIYGPETEDRVRYLQDRAGITVDGIAGPHTLGTLNMRPVDADELGAQQHSAPEEPADTEEDSDEGVGGKAPLPSTGSGDIVSPTTGELTSEFGERGGSHNGIDIANEIGTPIYSTAAGEVVESGPASGFGKWVRVQHGDGTISVYGHISRSLVSEGDQVAAGEQIAEMGNRGQSTGPHLHFEIWQDGGEKIDPLSWLQGFGVSL
jgi:murein DD-endopeptidase MepM/ murein hydrolase activator NlpD